MKRQVSTTANSKPWISSLSHSASVHLTTRGIGAVRRSDFFLPTSLVNGRWVDAAEQIEVRDPATGELVATVASLDTSWVDHAVEAGKGAFPAWRDLLPSERGAVLRRWAALMRRHRDDLATVIVLEQGKPLAEARSEVEYGASFFDWFAAEGERTYGETIPSHKAGCQLSVVVQPVGVTAAVTPWNFPCAMITRKAGAALAVGCTMIVKPAPETPLSALALARLGQEAGVPPGVFQIIIGEAAPLAKRLLEHAAVRAFSFTGSTDVGRLLLEQAAATVKKVSMELGGHAPFLVYDDAPLELAVQGCLAAKFATSGQDCLAVNRIYVQRGAYEPFVQAFSARASRLRVGHGLEPGVQIGPMTRLSIAEKCRTQIADAVARGASLTISSKDNMGHFVHPAVLSNVTDDMLIAREETFGPVAAILPFDDDEEVIARANTSEMGLAAYVYTRDLARATRATNCLEYGMVGVNTASFTGPPIPFGGWKQSGLGREGSRHGPAEYMQQKYVCLSPSF